MKKIIAIGEALIDFIPNTTGSIKEVGYFSPFVGGAPCNVCGAYSKLGGDAYLITQLGDDLFGDKILDEMHKYSIKTDYVRKTKRANTSLAFIALQENGEREFMFYRNPGADMLMTSDSLEESWFNDTYALHFCSVSLGNFPMKKTHKKAIEIARKKNVIISFDPNVRLPLWDSSIECKRAILEFLTCADILKISDEELEFITGEKDIDKAIPETAEKVLK